MYRLEEAASPVFARHETFHPRYGWFRKAVEAADGASNAFTRESATVDLGVGKNMVRAIRFWGRAAKVLADGVNPERPQQPVAVVSNSGRALLGDDALDPYLEAPGSLWLLHWWMLAPTSLLPVWWLAFHRFSPVEFSEDDLLAYVTDEIGRAPDWQAPAASSLKKDVDCLLHMYAPHGAGALALDDLLDCPFRELGLIEPVRGEKRRYRFILGPKSSLPAAMVTYACLDFLAATDAGGQTCALGSLLQSPGGPGRAFRLTEDALRTALETQSSVQDGIAVTSSAGIPQLAVDGDPAKRAREALAGYYASLGYAVPAANEIVLGPEPARPAKSLFDIAGRDIEARTDFFDVDGQQLQVQVIERRSRP